MNRSKGVVLPLCLRRYYASEVVRRVVAKRGFWRNAKNQKEFFDQLGRDLGVLELSGWYGVSRREVEQAGGRGVFNHYHSLYAALKAVYPDHPWLPSRFNAREHRAPAGFWNEKENLLKALEMAQQQLGIKEIEDWYSVTLSQMHEVGFPTHVSKTEFVQLLSEKYPDYKWEKVFLLRGKYGQQKRMERAVTSLFPGVEMKINARKEADLINPDTGDYLELDVFLPSLKLAFEYQDIHHYKTSEYAYQPLEVFQMRDETKKRLANEKGITLILVPCWWDGKQDSLTATIKKERSDLLTHLYATTVPIPEEIPPNFLDRYKKKDIEGVGEPMTACFLTGVHTDPTNWWLFEKYDGVRAFWNPIKRAFYSRHGNKFSLPPEVIDSMPSDIYLDGEIWFGRDTFQEAAKISGRVDIAGADWTKFKYMVFDIPNHNGIYAERYAQLEEKLGKRLWRYLEVAPKVKCEGIDHLEKFFQDIIDKSGEGVILRDPTAYYKPGRSAGYLKHKKFRDSEARIVSSVGPQLWECELPNGITFSAAAGTSEFVRRWNPMPGDIVSFKHRGYLLGSKKPLSPSLYRLRPDLSWDDVVNNFKDQSNKGTALPVQKGLKNTNRPKGYWLNIDNRRKFFLQFAKEMGFAPDIAENWLKITNVQILKKEGGVSILNNYNKSLKKALVHTFPELNFDFKDENKPKDHWKDVENCRQFFEEFATENGFDPLHPEHWYSVDLETLQSKKGGHTIAKHHGGLRKALELSFSEVTFEWKGTQTEQKKETGDKKTKGYWADLENRRRFFIEFANEKGFDPFIADNWQKITKRQIVTKKGGEAILYHFSRSVKTALQNTFPDLNFNFVETKKPANYWQEADNCRHFFEEFAQQKGINPLNPESWQSIDLEQMLSAKGGQTLSKQHGGFKKALQAAYPELTFEWTTTKKVHQ